MGKTPEELAAAKALFARMRKKKDKKNKKKKPKAEIHAPDEPESAVEAPATDVRGSSPTALAVDKDGQSAQPNSAAGSDINTSQAELRTSEAAGEETPTAVDTVKCVLQRKSDGLKILSLAPMYLLERDSV
jgi:hypothetical protein